jgi:hypothetical protein
MISISDTGCQSAPWGASFVSTFHKHQGSEVIITKEARSSWWFGGSIASCRNDRHERITCLADPDCGSDRSHLLDGNGMPRESK